MPSASAARATASASIRSDLPRSRLARLELAISRVGTRTTRSPRSIKNRSNEPETCRQSSSAQTRSAPRPRAQSISSAKPRIPTWAVLSPTSSPVFAATATRVCEHLCMSRTEHDHQLSPLLLEVEVDGRRTRLALGAATLLSSHAGHPEPATSDTAKGGQAAPRPTASKGVSSPPVGTFSSLPDITDSAQSKQQASKR